MISFMTLKILNGSQNVKICALQLVIIRTLWYLSEETPHYRNLMFQRSQHLRTAVKIYTYKYNTLYMQAVHVYIATRLLNRKAGTRSDVAALLHKGWR